MTIKQYRCRPDIIITCPIVLKKFILYNTSLTSCWGNTKWVGLVGPVSTEINFEWCECLLNEWTGKVFAKSTRPFSTPKMGILSYNKLYWLCITTRQLKDYIFKALLSSCRPFMLTYNDQTESFNLCMRTYQLKSVSTQFPVYLSTLTALLQYYYELQVWSE